MVRVVRLDKTPNTLWGPAATGLGLYVHGKLSAGYMEGKREALTASSATAACTNSTTLKLPPPTSAPCHDTRCVTTPPTSAFFAFCPSKADFRHSRVEQNAWSRMIVDLFLASEQRHRSSDYSGMWRYVRRVCSKLAYCFVYVACPRELN